MSNRTDPRLPPNLGSWLAAYCDADPHPDTSPMKEAAGKGVGRRPTASQPGNPFLFRFERAAKCLMLLNHVWPHGDPLDVDRLGNYQIVGRLGQGGMGVVYRAVHTRLKRPAAIKVLTPDHLTDASAVRRFQREMEAVGKLDHPNIVRASDAGEVDGRHFLAMELVEGIDLGKLLDCHGPVALPDACEIGRQAAVALNHVHRHGLVHRDIKPSNLMLSFTGQVKLLDLGLARLVPEDADPQQMIDTYRLLGTFDYMAPEQAAGPSAVDIRADLYSLGCVLAELLTGRLASNRVGELGSRKSNSLTCQLAYSLPDDVRQVLQRLLAPDRTERYSTPAEAARALEPPARGHDLKSLAQGIEVFAQSSQVASERVDEWASGPTDPLTRSLAHSPEAFDVVKDLPQSKRNRKRLTAILASLCVIVPAAALALPSAVFLGSSREDRGTAAIPQTGIESDADRRLGTWNFPPSGDPLPGLIPQPAALPGMDRWQVDTVAPRGFVYGIAWSPDSQLLAVGSSDHYIRVYDADTHQLIHVFAGHTRDIPCLAWSPDGRWLASAGGFRDWSVRLWSLEDGTPGPMIETHWGALSVTWSPDGRRLAFARRSPTDHIQVWEPFEGTLIHSFSHENRRVYSLSWSPDGKWIASLGDDSLRLWNAQSGSAGPVFAGAEEDKSGHFTQLLAWSPDSRRIAAPGPNRTIRTWDVATGRQGPTLEGHSDAVKSIAWSPDGGRIASGGFDSTIRVWAAETGEQRRVLKHAWWVASVAWSPDGRHLASGSRNGTVRLWDSETGGQVWEFGSKWPAAVSTSWASLSWSPDGRSLATGGADATVRLWDIERARQQRVLGEHEGAVNYLRWSPEGRRLASATYGPYGSVRLWDIEGGTHQHWEDSVTGAPEWSPDARWIAIPGYRNVQIYDADDGNVVRGLRGHTDHVLAVAWSPDGRLLASGGDDRTIRLWSAADGEVAAVLKGHDDEVGWLAWDPANDWLVSAGMIQGQSGSLHRWDVRRISAVEHASFEIEKWFLTTGWDRARARLATGHGNGDVWIRDGGDATPVLRLSGHAESVRQLAWSPTAPRVASASDDYTLRVWNTDDGTPLWLALLLPSGEAAVFSPKGEWLNPEAVDHEQLVYLIERASGALELYTPAEFHDQFRRQERGAVASGPSGTAVSR